jgi:hypothetical protein
MRILQLNLKRTYTYNNTHEQQPYCVGTISQMTERSAERRVRQETGWLADHCSVSQQLGALQTHTTDTFLFISHTTNVPLFKFRCNIFIGVRIIKEMPASVANGIRGILLLDSANGTHCCTATATMVTRTHHKLTVYVHCIPVI